MRDLRSLILVGLLALLPAARALAADAHGEKTEHKPAEHKAPAAPVPSGDKALPGKIPPLNTVVETPAGRAKKDANKAEEAAPTVTISALRDELRRVGSDDGGSGARKSRERLEQLSKELNKTREGLRQDTAKLEALLAKGVPEAPAAAEPGEGGKKAPLPLDILAKAMRGMKPEQAAPIVSRMEKKLAADVLQRMPAADAGKVMGQLKPEVAAELAAEIASRTPRAELKR